MTNIEALQQALKDHGYEGTLSQSDIGNIMDAVNEIAYKNEMNCQEVQDGGAWFWDSEYVDCPNTGKAKGE